MKSAVEENSIINNYINDKVYRILYYKQYHDLGNYKTIIITL